MAFQKLDQCQAFPYTFGEYARRFAWEWVQTLLIRPSPRRAYGWRRFWLRAFGAKLGPHSSIRNTTQIFHPWLLELGDWSMLADRVVIYNLGPIRIGAHCTVSQDAQLCAGTHDYSQSHMPLVRSPIEVGDGVWICAGAFVGPGVKVGEDAVVGARAVVTRDVPAGMVVAGNPAKVIKPRPMGK